MRLTAFNVLAALATGGLRVSGLEPSRGLPYPCVLFVRLTAFNVLAALVTGGLGVSGLDLACGLPYPTLGPPVCRGAAKGRPLWG